MKDETGCFAMEEFLGLKSKMYSFLVDDSSEHEKAKGVNKNVVATITHGECKYVLLNNISHKTGTYQINKLSLKCFEYIVNNGYDGLLHLIMRKQLC